MQGELRDSSYLPLNWHPWSEELLPDPRTVGKSCISRVKLSFGLTTCVILVLVRDPLSSPRIHPSWVSDQTFPPSCRLCHLTSGSLERPAHRRMCRPWTRGPASVCSRASSVVAKDMPSRAVARLWLLVLQLISSVTGVKKNNIRVSTICHIGDNDEGLHPGGWKWLNGLDAYRTTLVQMKWLWARVIVGSRHPSSRQLLIILSLCFQQ